MKNIKRGVLLLGLLAFSSFVRADYVCEVTMLNNLTNSTYGQHGFVLARFYTGRNCTGSFIYQKWYCSEGATASGCAVNPSYHFSETALTSVYENLANAAYWNRQVRPTNTACFSGASTCGGALYFTSRY